LLWIGWCRERRVPDASELQAPTEQQKVLTAAAVDRLRAVFSAGARQSIYEKADRHFRSQTEVDWLYECNRLRDNLGIWQRFNIHSTEAYGTSKRFILLEGSAVFAKMERRLGLTWRMGKGSLQLESLSFEENGTWREIPVRPGLLMDPPPPSAYSPGML
jgi:hypothetical protein